MKMMIQRILSMTITNSAKPVIIPHMGFAYGWDNSTAFIGFTTPYAGDFSYPADGPQRYSLIDTVVSIPLCLCLSSTAVVFCRCWCELEHNENWAIT